MTKDVEILLKNNLKYHERILKEHKMGIHLIYETEEQSIAIINDLKDCLTLIEE